VRAAQSSNLDHDRVLRAHVRGIAAVDDLGSDPRNRHSALWRRLRHFLDRTRNAATRIVRSAALSDPDRPTGISKPDCAGALAGARRAAARAPWSQCDDCGADRIRGRQPGGDWPALAHVSQHTLSAIAASVAIVLAQATRRRGPITTSVPTIVQSSPIAPAV